MQESELLLVQTTQAEIATLKQANARMQEAQAALQAKCDVRVDLSLLFFG